MAILALIWIRTDFGGIKAFYTSEESAPPLVDVLLDEGAGQGSGILIALVRRCRGETAIT